MKIIFAPLLQFPLWFMNGLTYPFSLTNIASRPQNIVNDIFTPFTVISNTYIKDVLIKEVSQLFSPDRSLT